MAKALWAEFCCAALILVAAGCSSAPSDAVITADAQNRVRADQRIHSNGIQLNANHGVLTLTGITESDAERVAAGEDASQVNGLKVLVNNLRVADISQAEETSPPADRTTASEDPVPPQRMARAQVAPVAKVPVSSHKPSPAIAKSDSSSLPIVTDPGPTPASTRSPSSVPPSALPVSNPNPAVNLPTRPANTAGVASVAGTNSSQSMASAMPPKPRKVSVPYGTVLSVRMLETVSSDQNQPGDKFTASLVSPVMVDNQVVIPADAGLHGKVIEAESGGRFGGKPSLAIELDEVSYNGQTYTIATNQFSKQGTSRSTKAMETIGGGAGVGAILGAIVGGGRGAAIGAAIGAGVGTGVQAKGKGSEVELPSESLLSFRLKSPISIEPADTLLRSPNSTQDASADPFPNDRPVLKRRPGAGAADPEPPSEQPPNASAPDNSQPSAESSDPNNDSRPVLKQRPN
jgi:hypothetical protein